MVIAFLLFQCSFACFTSCARTRVLNCNYDLNQQARATNHKESACIVYNVTMIVTMANKSLTRSSKLSQKVSQFTKNSRRKTFLCFISCSIYNKCSNARLFYGLARWCHDVARTFLFTLVTIEWNVHNEIVPAS